MTAAKQPPGVEVGKAFDLNMKPLTQDVVGSAEGHSVKLPNFNVPYAVIHTHPACGVFSPGDLLSFVDNESLKLIRLISNSFLLSIQNQQRSRVPIWNYTLNILWNVTSRLQ